MSFIINNCVVQNWTTFRKDAMENFRDFTTQGIHPFRKNRFNFINSYEKINVLSEYSVFFNLRKRNFLEHSIARQKKVSEYFSQI